MSKKSTEDDPKPRALTSTNSDRYQESASATFARSAVARRGASSSRVFPIRRLASESVEEDLEVQLHRSPSSEAEPEMVALREESPPLASAFALSTSFEEEILDLK